jgi:hypothetical protein
LVRKEQLAQPDQLEQLVHKEFKVQLAPREHKVFRVLLVPPAQLDRPAQLVRKV